MIIFKKADDEIYLLTNYKVMYSSLSKQENLQRIGPSKKLYYHALMSWVSARSKFYLVVRNPFDRIRSFYKSKFLMADDYRLWMKKNNLGKWQECTEYFFPYLGLNTDMDPSEVSTVLSNTDYNKVISVLPEVYMKDGHMKPQYLSRNFTIEKFGLSIKLPIKFEQIFKIENRDDLNTMSKIFGLDLSRKYHSSGHIEDTIDRVPETKQTILKLYQNDFMYFKYDRD
jgi:hypothetical protein